jgi:hypothetical protein
MANLSLRQSTRGSSEGYIDLADRLDNLDVETEKSPGQSPSPISLGLISRGLTPR